MGFPNSGGTDGSLVTSFNYTHIRKRVRSLNKYNYINHKCASSKAIVFNQSTTRPHSEYGGTRYRAHD